MATYSRRKPKRSRWESTAPFFASGIGFILVALLVPANPSHKIEKRIFSDGISVEIDHSSPAFAALEDTLAQRNETPETISHATTQLMAGQESLETTATAIAQANVLEEKLVNEEREQEQRTIDAVKSVATSFFAPSEPAAPSVDVVVVEKAETKKAETKEVVEHPTQVISLSTWKMKPDDFAKGLLGPIARAPQPSAPPKYNRVASNPPPTEQEPSFLGSGVSKPEAHGLVAAKADDNTNANIHQVLIAGPLEFSGGVALTSSSDRVVVYREEDNEVIEPGAVWLREGRYEIFVEQPVGQLVAELRAANGEIMARGTYELDQLPSIKPSQPRVEKIAIKMGPVPHGILGRVITANVGKAKSEPVMNTQVQLEQLPLSALTHRDGTFEEKSIMEGSSIVVRAERPGHWGTLAFADAGEPSEISIFSDSTMKTMLSSIAPYDSDLAKNSSVVWGRVVRSGKPVAGARVDLMTTTDEMRPIYFNSMNLPDPTLTATSENGLYAFFPVSPGAHAVRAADTRGATEPVLFPADAQAVSQVDLELAIDRKAKVRVFDAFKTDWPLSAEVASAGRTSGTIVDRSGETTIRFASGHGQLVLDADAGPAYQRVRLMVPRDRRTIDFPMVQGAWLDRLRGSLRIDSTPGTGTVVGFIQGAQAYRISMDELSVNGGTRIVYFDSRGQISKNDYGQNGGGFIVFNLPEGFRTLFVQPSGTSKSFAASLLVESKVTNVMTRNLKQ